MHAISANWPAPSTIKAFTSLRTGGLSDGGYESFNIATHVGDDLEIVKNNRERLIDNLNLPNTSVWLQQEHGAQVVCAHAAADTQPTADGSWTHKPNVVCVVQTADCLPIVLADKAGSTVVAIHAGWRSLNANILQAAVNRFNCARNDILAWFGPAISQAAYKVDHDLYHIFSKQLPELVVAFQRSDDKWLCDLTLIAELLLQACGVNAIYRSGHCTYRENDKFFSYRRNNKTGRMATLVWKQTLGPL